MTSGVIVQVGVSSEGVPKRTVPEAAVGAGGLAGDSFDHPNIHGGSRQAILLITEEGIDELTALGYKLLPGCVGREPHDARTGQASHPNRTTLPSG